MTNLWCWVCVKKLFLTTLQKIASSKAIKAIGKPNATEDIVNVIEKLIA
jgi:hypothetical protein